MNALAVDTLTNAMKEDMKRKEKKGGK